jgi:hypothetical protein
MVYSAAHLSQSHSLPSIAHLLPHLPSAIVTRAGGRKPAVTQAATTVPAEDCAGGLSHAKQRFTLVRTHWLLNG